MSKEALDGSRARRGLRSGGLSSGGLHSGGFSSGSLRSGGLNSGDLRSGSLSVEGRMGASRRPLSCRIFNWLVLEKGEIKALAAKREIFGLNRKTHLFSHRNSV